MIEFSLRHRIEIRCRALRVEIHNVEPTLERDLHNLAKN